MRLGPGFSDTTKIKSNTTLPYRDTTASYSKYLWWSVQFLEIMVSEQTWHRVRSRNAGVARLACEVEGLDMNDPGIRARANLSQSEM